MSDDSKASENSPPDTGSKIWAQICSHVDGIAIGTTVSTLRQRGVFDRLIRCDRPLPISGLAKEFGLKTGYFHLAMRLLELQGLVHRRGNLTDEEGSVDFSTDGRKWCQWLSLYDAMPAIVEAALAVPACMDGQQKWNLPNIVDAADTRSKFPHPLENRVTLQTIGPLVGAIMCEFDRRRVWTEVFHPDSGGAVADLAALPAQWKPAFDILARQGWLKSDERNLLVTPAGEIARQISALYWVPVSYLPTFAKVPEMLCEGSPTEVQISPELDGTEWHINRALDIAASGLIFSHFCKRPFLEIALPLFNDPNVAGQPTAIVDTGSGDGTLLLELYRAIVSQTIRGRHLTERPLIMVGAEYTAVARTATAKRLCEADIPHVTVFGDIGDPAGLAQALQQQGLDPHDVLHVSKSVVHNRTYEPPADTIEFASWGPISKAVFINREGELILAKSMELNLVEHFRKWRGWIARHGMIVVEAHATDPSEAARMAGLHVMTGLESCHGYSHQYLVESEVHGRCAAAAGLKNMNSRTVFGQIAARPLFSLDHFVVDDRK